MDIWGKEQLVSGDYKELLETPDLCDSYLAELFLWLKLF